MVFYQDNKEKEGFLAIVSWADKFTQVICQVYLLSYSYLLSNQADYYYYYYYYY